MKLTEMKCKNVKPESKAKKFFDGLGLYLEVVPSGSKYWRLKYRHLGKEKRLSFGVYPEVTLKEAREKRDEARKLIAQQKDPSYVKKQLKNHAIEEAGNTFEKAAREWHAHNKDGWTQEHAQTIMSRLEKDVFPSIGGMPIKEVPPKVLLDMAKGIQQRGANELAKRVIQMSKHIFQYAIITAQADTNPAIHLKGMIKPTPTKHYAAIDHKELPDFLKDLNSNKACLKPLTLLAVKFMMLTFVRTGEMIGAQWREIDFENKEWLVPAKRMKMGKEHLVPLSDQAIEVLKEIRELHVNETFVFPSRTNSKSTMSNNTILMALDRMGYRGKMTGHGFRSLAMSTVMEKLGYRFEVPDAQLAHSKKGDVNKAYDRAKFLDERKMMMQDWADYLERIAK